MQRKSSTIFWLATVCFFAGILIAQQYLVRQGSDLIPGTGGDFTLQSAHGPTRLSDFRGKVVAMYFGYMSCPDICPTAMWNLTEGVNTLAPELVDDGFQGVFVSVDYERDSPRALDIFVKGFHTNMVGLTGETREQIDKVARQYGAIYEKVPLEGSAMGYVIDHSSVVYLIDRQGILRYRVAHGTPPGEIAQQVAKLLDEA